MLRGFRGTYFTIMGSVKDSHYMVLDLVGSDRVFILLVDYRGESLRMVDLISMQDSCDWIWHYDKTELIEWARDRQQVRNV